MYAISLPLISFSNSLSLNKFIFLSKKLISPEEISKFSGNQLTIA